MHEEAQRLSLTDPLTGLWNYRYLRESLRREVERASRFGRMLAVLALDLDHFKEVNDTYGHAAGDAVLAEFARRVRVGLREVDVAFRQGGEEFVVLLPETDAYGGAIVAERLGAAVRGRPGADRARRADAATGRWSTGSDHRVDRHRRLSRSTASTAQQVLDAADDALYAAKSGRPGHVPRWPKRPSPGRRAGRRDTCRRSSATGRRAGGPQPPRQSRGR